MLSRFSDVEILWSSHLTFTNKQKTLFSSIRVLHLGYILWYVWCQNKSNKISCVSVRDNDRCVCVCACVHVCITLCMGRWVKNGWNKKDNNPRGGPENRSLLFNISSFLRANDFLVEIASNAYHINFSSHKTNMVIFINKSTRIE